MAAPRSNENDLHRSVSPSPAASPDGAGGGSGVHVLRSEERLQVGTAVTVTGRAVLRKYIVTETVTQTFQVRHEEVRLDYEPALDDEPFSSPGAVFDDRVVEMILHREVPEVQMQVIPTERVMLHITTITEHVEVPADLRREQLDLDDTSRR